MSTDTKGSAEEDAARPFSMKLAVSLSILVLVYTVNIIDRQILGILAQKIKGELDLTDTQLGVLGGLGFALFYAVLAIPFAALADSVGPKRVVAASLAVWSFFTAACGLVVGFPLLLLCRVGVGVGEAGGAAPSYAIVASMFPPRWHGRATALFALAIPLGGALGMLAGGEVAHRFGWRSVFVALGIFGLVLTPIFSRFVPEAVTTRKPAIESVRVLSATWRAISKQRAFWLLGAGMSAASMMGYGLAFWLPTLMQRSFGLTLVQTGWFVGMLLLCGGTAGTILGGVLADRSGRTGKGAYVQIPAIAFLACVPFYLVGIMATNWMVAFPFLLIATALTNAWFGPVLAAVQHLVAKNQRATASAFLLLLNNLFGIGFGALLLGYASDRLTPRLGSEALRYSVAGGLSLYVLASILLLVAAAPLAAHWRDD